MARLVLAAALLVGSRFCNALPGPGPSGDLGSSTLVFASASGLDPLREACVFPASAGRAWELRPLLRHPANDPALATALGLDRVFVLRAPTAAEAEALGSAWLAAGWCEGLALDRAAAVHTADTSSERPNDPLFPDQYALANVGQIIGNQPGEPGADIHLLAAWARAPETSPVTVAVFDAGISRSHPDLQGVLVPGWNFVDDSEATDDQFTSHGTHCAGIIGARGSNNLGISGICRRARIMPVVVLNRYGFGNESTLAEALVWAADQGVHVGSVSLGFDPTQGGSTDRALHAAVRYATQRGMLICASAGNVPTAGIAAPARYPETIAVGATDNRDQPWSGTSTGPEMSLAAPGVAVVSTWDSASQGAGVDTYDAKTGTSQACPHVAGVAALMFAANPALTPSRVRSMLTQTAEDIGPAGWDPASGAGRLDADAAVARALDSIHPGPGGAATGNCPADFDGDGVLDARDLVAFLGALDRLERRADLASPRGVFDSRDALEFIARWAAGCP